MHHALSNRDNACGCLKTKGKVEIFLRECQSGQGRTKVLSCFSLSVSFLPLLAVIDLLVNVMDDHVTAADSASSFNRMLRWGFALSFRVQRSSVVEDGPRVQGETDVSKAVVICCRLVIDVLDSSIRGRVDWYTGG